MKAKMTDKPPEVGTYLCNKCNTSFSYKSGTLHCPKCQNQVRRYLVPIGMKDNPAEEEMYTDADWHGG